MNIRLYKKFVKILSPIFIILTLIASSLCCFYAKRKWNAFQFETFDSHWDFFIAYLIELVCLIIFFVLFIYSQKGIMKTLKKIISIISCFILSCSILAVAITIIANIFSINDVIEDFYLDKNLSSENPDLFYKSVDELIKRSSYVSSYNDEPNEYILKAAREGYPKAQNAMGYFYHERAKRALYEVDHSNYNENRNNHFITQSEEDFDHAIFWFLKAAQNQYATAQTNLGRIFMGEIASNRYPDLKLAKQWLIKACNNGDKNAFYYIGKIYSNENLRDAYVYWSKGAELGSEACARELEKPEFALGIPDDMPVTFYELKDSVVIEQIE